MGLFRSAKHGALLIATLAAISLIGGPSHAGETALAMDQELSTSLTPGAESSWTSPAIDPGVLLEFEASVSLWDMKEGEEVLLTLRAEGQRDVTKRLNPGDPGMLVPLLVAKGGTVRASALATAGRPMPIRIAFRTLRSTKETTVESAFAFEAEPNNSWREAQPMKIGRPVYGNNDDTDYLDNKDEKPVKNYANGLDNPVRDRPGLDWFRIDIPRDDPRLVIFELDVLDRDVSVNLRMYVANKEGSDVELFTDGMDPMEIVHDREPERYSKSITRTLNKGTYYLQVNGNHPRYILRSKAYLPPPYPRSADAVRTGAHYIMNVGDAWVAQVPREGNIYRRVQNMHDTALRCTACHPSIFSTEAVLTARKAGFPIEAKSNFRYVVDRIYNGPTPLYGPHEVNWQRYIAIPLQSQGKHGGILMDFEKYVSQRETPTFLRYAPFLRKAWTGREKLPDDEQNGVVPADSNVGFAVRDWRVLTEAYRRTNDASYKETADGIRSLITGDKCDRKNIQDKLHRLWGLVSMREGPEEFETEIAAAVQEINSLQNDDGGWPDVIEPGRASAVYTTGQALWTLAQAGRTTENEPRMNQGVNYLLQQQQPFGGWFQTTTHENFRTPMRETRYAVMALAATNPNAKDPPPGWGNRDGKDARLPRADSLVHLLDDLDNLWEVPKGREAEFTAAIIPLLDRREPLVRSLAAETLGRVGTDSAIAPLVKLLADPVKDVWRSAAWALRQFGNRGPGLDAIRTALRSDDPATRRGAARVFAYHFYGMDERLDYARDLMKLTNDPNFWTRLETLKTLRQWFYRSGDNAFKREVVDLYIDHMSRPEHSAIRTNLEQGMYIMLDENEAGGVSLERNLAELPREADREASIAARREVEKSVLLEPLLEAMATGNQLQREALLASFDGSFFAGRFYARNPTAMIDVGNDREFSFYYQPPETALDRTFMALLTANLAPERQAEAFQLASFFHVPRDSEDAELQTLLLDGARRENVTVRDAALKTIREDLALKSAPPDGPVMDRLASMLDDPSIEVREAALLALKRNEGLLKTPRVMASIQKITGDENQRRLALAILDAPVVPQDQAIKILQDTWLETDDESLRMTLIDRLFSRKETTDSPEPSRELVKLLKTIALDPMNGVRERLLEKLEKAEKLRRSPRMAPVYYSGLSDTSPGIRLRSLRLAREQPEFWKEGDMSEYALRLLVDPDPKIRALALDSVKEFDLLGREPRFARRVKALSTDKALGPKALALLTSHGLDPAAVEADGAVQSFGIPDLDFFREKVNPYFYKEAADAHSCYDCHQNHNILRIASKPLGASELPEDLVIQNLNSALKVVNLGDPEQSLILRKPRSPQGQGSANAESPTGLTHVGGPRWPSSADAGYQAVLAWIRDAATSTKRRLGVAASVDSYSPDYPAVLALDGDPQTIWHTEFVGATPPYPHEITIDLGQPSRTSAFQYVPRQDSSNGRVKAWELYVSRDGKEWGEKAASGEWSDDGAVKTVPLRAEGIHFVKLRGLSSVNGQPMMSAAEVIVLKARESAETAAAR